MKLFWIFARIGAFTIGGGYAMIPLIEKELVDKYAWLSKEEFVDALAIAQATPGILAVNIAVLTGHKLQGFKGSLIACLGSVLPSFLMILAIAMFFSEYQNNIYVDKMFKAIRPAVVALIAVPVLTTAKQVKINTKTIIIPIAAAILIWAYGISPIYIILAAGIGGWIIGRMERKKIV
ncbi:chromate transporter [Bacteroidales bacterium]|nr:chromate transporter [Bacteroidales bacterium]